MPWTVMVPLKHTDSWEALEKEKGKTTESNNLVPDLLQSIFCLIIIIRQNI